MKHPTNNVFGGFLTIYMVATAWATARRREGETGILDWVGFVFATWCAGLPAKRRIARHLWLMCFGWFIATGSFFLGQQQVFPAWLRGRLCFLVRPCCHWRC